MRTTLFISLVMTLVSGSAFAECKTANLQSQDGSKIAIRYSSNSQTDGLAAWVSSSKIYVTASQDKCHAQTAGVELVSTFTPNCGGGSISHHVELVRDTETPCVFSAAVPANILLANHCGALIQQIAVRVGDEWLVDPLSGLHNFNYSIFANYSPQSENCTQ